MSGIRFPARIRPCPTCSPDGVLRSALSGGRPCPTCNGSGCEVTPEDEVLVADWWRRRVAGASRGESLLLGGLVAVRLCVPWRDPRRKTKEASLTLRAQARGRWRWIKLTVFSPSGTHREQMNGTVSLTAEAKTWLTDNSLRGNLRRKAFARVGVKLGAGGAPDVGGGCEVLSESGKRCTWERGHEAMRVHYDGSPAPGVFPHSWATPRLGRNATVVVEPRRPRG